MLPLSLFFGRANDVEARVYAQCEAEAGQIVGTVRGPHCEYAQTLPATATFRDLGPGPSVLAEAVIVDPCFWTPAEPYTYQVKLEFLQAGVVREATEHLFGIRPLGVDKHNLVLKSKRWVLRGVKSDSPPDWSAWRDAHAALRMVDPSNELLQAASRFGVLVAAELTAEHDPDDELERLSRWPAVGVALLPAGAAVRRPPRNLLLAEQFGVESPITPSPWAQLVVSEVDDPARFATRVAKLELPVLAMRPLDGWSELTTARAACDHLQRDLSPHGDFAGYLV